MSMELKKPAMAGTTESSDVMVMLRPNPAGGIVIDLKSDVMVSFGDAIEATVRDVMKEFDVNDAQVSIVDKGALDFVIRARMQCAICRAAEIQYYWGKEDGYVKLAHAYLHVRGRHQPGEDDPGRVL